MINEGVKDKTALKFIFLAGGPGSGKTYLANKLFGIDKGVNFSKDGLKMVSFDDIFEQILERDGWPKDLTTLAPEDQKWVMSDHPKSPRQEARNLMKQRMKLMSKNQTGMLFDGTGQSAYTYINRKKEMEDLGYDVSIVYVDTDLDTAMERNAARERRLPDEVVKKIWNDVQHNKEIFQKHFGDNMVVINNSKDAPIDETLPSAIDRLINQPIKNKFGQKLLQNQDDPTKLQGILKQREERIEAERVAAAKAAAEKAAAQAAKWKSQQQHSFGDGDPAWGGQWKGSSSKSKGPETVKNPVTGNDIKIKTALDYPKEHPAHKAADQAKGTSGKPKSGYANDDTPSYFKKFQDKQNSKHPPKQEEPAKKKSSGFKQYFDDFWKDNKK